MNTESRNQMPNLAWIASYSDVYEGAYPVCIGSGRWSPTKWQIQNQFRHDFTQRDLTFVW